MKCLIVAAGRGRRIASLGPSKPLVPLLGRPLIEWVLGRARQAGVRDFLVITGYNGDLLTRRLKEIAARLSVQVQTRVNDRWEEPNGLSVLAAAELLDGPFVLLMADHLFDPAILSDLLRAPSGNGSVQLVVDYGLEENEFVDTEDVTRVLVQKGRILDIGKGIPRYNAYDTGIFLGNRSLFDALEENQRKGAEMSISAAMRLLGQRGRALGVDSGGRFWIDVDDEKALRKAEKHLLGGRRSDRGGREPAGSFHG